MTLPELCECSENPESTMPNATSTTTTSSSGIAGTDSANTTSTTTTTTSLGEALKSVLQQASSQGRVTCSLTSCVDLLSTHPDDVMLCVMPLLPHPDAAATIQSTLIRAVCLEHNIRVLSVDCDVKLAKTVCLSELEEEEEEAAARGVVAGFGVLEETVDDNFNRVWKTPATCSEDVDGFLITGIDNLAPVMGFPCVLVRYPVHGASKEDELVAEFCKEQLFGHTQQEPYIELPD